MGVEHLPRGPVHDIATDLSPPPLGLGHAARVVPGDGRPHRLTRLVQGRDGLAYGGGGHGLAPGPDESAHHLADQSRHQHPEGVNVVLGQTASKALGRGGATSLGEQVSRRVEPDDLYRGGADIHTEQGR